MKKEFNEVPDREQTEPSKLEQILNSEKQEEHTPCACFCQGWAEIYVRRPTGDMSWMMRIQNSMQFENPIDFPAQEITALYMPMPEYVHFKNQEVTSEFSGDEMEVEFSRLFFVWFLFDKSFQKLFVFFL